MENPTTVYLMRTERNSPVDLDSAKKSIRAAAGVVYLQLDPVPEVFTSGIIIPEEAYDLGGTSETPVYDTQTGRYVGVKHDVKKPRGALRERMRPDVGTVIASGGGADPDFPVVGERYVIFPECGVNIENLAIGSYVADTDVRVIGRWIDPDIAGAKIEFEDWHECLLAKFVEPMENTLTIKRPDWTNGGEPVTEQLRACGTKVIIKRDPVIESDLGILLTDSQKYRSSTATVISVGNQVWRTEPGERIHYDANGLVDVKFCDDLDIAIIDQDAIFAAIGNEHSTD